MAGDVMAIRCIAREAVGEDCRARVLHNANGRRIEPPRQARSSLDALEPDVLEVRQGVLEVVVPPRATIVTIPEKAAVVLAKPERAHDHKAGRACKAQMLARAARETGVSGWSTREEKYPPGRDQLIWRSRRTPPRPTRTLIDFAAQPTPSPGPGPHLAARDDL